jgi:hypothetical protein
MSTPSNKVTRESTITSMCYTWRHDYGIKHDAANIFAMTDLQKQFLWDQMAQLYDNDISPTHTLTG